MKKNTYNMGFNFIEVMVVLAIFGLLLGVILNAITNADKSFRDSSYQIERQQESRKGVDRIAWELRNANPSWDINGTSYNVSINSSGDQLDFYVPEFDSSGQITTLLAVRYSVGGLNNAQLLRQQGAEAAVVANNIDTSGLVSNPLFSFVTSDNSVVDISIPILKNNDSFRLTSRANLRNKEIDLEPDVAVEDIVEEEET